MSVSERFLGANVIDAGRLSPYWGEHAARYVFALPFVRNKAVMDIACGTGYGIGILQRDAKRVIGVDVDIEAARRAVGECSVNSSVLLADGLCLPFADNSFDVVTSFETIEHLHERGLFLSELRRVIRSDGILVLSTPNANYTKPDEGRPSNPFHVFEYTPDELRFDIEKEFPITSFLGQELNIGSSIPPFYEAQQRLPKDLATQVKLISWKVVNKLPRRLRDRLSESLWGRPFYPAESDYVFSPQALNSAPVLVVVCRNRK
ncbi:MAG: class I SAM-dependent methyltransferase [Blastocatellia bacterium]|nr:class I SAM-dependent methyltransferase [Chloracidobacterium sp.]MBL8186194.1 class I SAM-dependent methyltransferase [Blastocatellia bacterium]